MVPAILLATACGDGGPTAAAEGRLDVVGGQRIEVRAVVGPIFYSGMDQRAREVLRSRSQWEAAWSRIWRTHTPEPPAPAVDFAREAVVVAAMGARATGGYVITVDSATATPGTIHVFVTERSPGPCLTTQAFTQPGDAVAIPADGRAVRFHESAIVKCGA